MKKRKPGIIKDKKLRGEWAESVFMARASEYGLPVSKPWGEMCSYDFIIGKTGRFVSVQVKSTTSQLETGYVCTVRGGHKAYRPGSFDFLAAYAVLADAWYIIPAPLIRGKRSITLFPQSPNAKYQKYEQYREAWHLLREASQISEDAEPAAEEFPAPEPEVAPPSSAMGRMQTAANYFRRYMERANVALPKSGGES
jgi:hypothetical protein